MAYTKQPKILSLLSTYFLFFNLYLLFPQTAGKTPGTGFLPSLDPSKKISQYVYDTWTKEDGLPSDSIWAITQTTDGYLWLGTFHGLVRFNGVDFKVFNRDNIPQLTNNRISALWAKKNGGLWIGTESDGLLLYNKGKFTQYDVHKGLPDNWVLSIMEDHKGDTWIGSTMGLARLHKGNVTTMTPEKDAGDFYGIMEESPGIVWFCSRNSGLFRLESGEFRKYTTADGLSGNDVKGICKDKEGTLWISCEYHGLNYYRNGKFSPYDDATVTTDKFIATLLCDRAGTIWVDSFYGLRRLKRPPGGRDAYVLDIFTPADGLTDSRIRSIFEDREGNLWVGTYKGGLNRFKDGCLTTMTSSEGLAQNFIRALFEDSRGNVWVGTNRNGVNLINGESITHYTTADGLPTNCIRCFEEDGTGTIWIGTTRGLISYKNGGFIKTPPTAETLFNHSIRCIYAPSQGVVAPSHGVVAPSHGVVAPPPGDAITLWVGTYNGGLIYLKNNAFTYVPLSPPLDSAKTTWIREYPPQSGTMWVGTSRGLLRMKEGRHTLYSKNDGLNVPNLTTVFIDDAGTFWLGTSGGGLYRFKDGSFFPYTTSDGLVDDSIWSIYEDRNHRFWFSCDSGIFRIHRRELKSFAGGKINRLNAVVFGKQDGMKSTECNGGGNPFIVHRKQMQLWYPTAGGITRVTPCALKTKTLPPPVRIEDIRIGGLSREPGMKAPVPAGKKDFEFHYAALSYSNPRGIRYKYKLVGYNEHWVDAENRRIAYYTNLLPGEYTFKVVAANVGSDWNMEGAHKSFVLEARFYQTYWFYSLLALLLAAVITLGYRLRVAAVHSRNRQLLKEIAERKRAEEQLKHLRNLLKNIIDSMPSVLIGVDREGRVTHWNHQAARATNIEAEAAFGKLLKDIYPDFQTEMDKMQRAVKLNKPLVEERVARKINNETHFFNITIYPLTANGVQGAVIRIDDVTEFEKKESQLRQIQKMETVGTLAGGLAHDFNNILGGIVGTLTIAKHQLESDGGIDTESMTEFLQMMEECSQRATHMVKQLMTLSRKQDLSFAPVDLNMTIKNVMKLCANSLDKSVTLNPLFHEDPALVKADPTQLEQLLLNFCVNAAHAVTFMRPETDTWGGTLTVSLGNIHADRHFRELHPEAKKMNYWNLSVRDNGVGMDAETSAKIFNPFFTKKEKEKGTGLGLAMAYSIVKQHGGFIHFYSLEGSGTTFNIYFPQLEEDTAAAETAVEEQKVRKGSGLILVVDDEHIMRKIATSILKECGYDVVTAENGKEGLKIFNQRRKEIKAVLLDMAMPELSGKDTYIRLKQIDANVKVLLASGFKNEARVNALLEQGVKDFIQKPYTLKKLAASMYKALNN